MITERETDFQSQVQSPSANTFSQAMDLLADFLSGDNTDPITRKQFFVEFGNAASRFAVFFTFLNIFAGVACDAPRAVPLPAGLIPEPIPSREMYDFPTDAVLLQRAAAFFSGTVVKGIEDHNISDYNWPKLDDVPVLMKHVVPVIRDLVTHLLIPATAHLAGVSGTPARGWTENLPSFTMFPNKPIEQLYKSAGYSNGEAAELSSRDFGTVVQKNSGQFRMTVWVNPLRLREVSIRSLEQLKETHPSMTDKEQRMFLNAEFARRLAETIFPEIVGAIIARYQEYDMHQQDAYIATLQTWQAAENLLSGNPATHIEYSSGMAIRATLSAKNGEPPKKYTFFEYVNHAYRRYATRALYHRLREYRPPDARLNSIPQTPGDVVISGVFDWFHKKIGLYSFDGWLAKYREGIFPYITYIRRQLAAQYDLKASRSLTEADVLHIFSMLNDASPGSPKDPTGTLLDQFRSPNQRITEITGAIDAYIVSRRKAPIEHK